MPESPEMLGLGNDIGLSLVYATPKKRKNGNQMAKNIQVTVKS